MEARTNRCAVCEADFYLKDLVEGKCKQCTELYPDCKNKLEAMAKHGGKEVNKMGDELDEARVQEIVNKAMESVVHRFEESLDNLVKQLPPTEKRGPGRTKKEAK